MSHAPFDGLILDDPRPPVPGSTAALLHLRVARAQTGASPGLEALKARAEACRDLMAHGLWPSTLRRLEAFGLRLGSASDPRDLAALAMHLEAYLAAVEAAGYLEPDRALWEAVDREDRGQRALWVERTTEDGPLEAGLQELLPARLRLLACVPRIGPVRFRLATRKCGATSGLFGSTQPLADWFLEGLEAHGHRFPNEILLAEPEGWGDAPWDTALADLFEGPMDLEPFRAVFQRGLVESPFDLLRHAVEQILAWLDAGIEPREITVVHPAPQAVASHLEALLAEEGVALHVRGGLRPLMASKAWSPLWALLQGLAYLDPVTFASGLGASTRKDLRAWADALGKADQNGEAPFVATLAALPAEARPRCEASWARVGPWRAEVLPARQWAERLRDLRALLKPAGDPEAFFAPHDLLTQAWDDSPWDLRTALDALEVFLESARDADIPREADGVRLVSPSTLLDEWTGSRATLVLDLSEGAWPALPEPNPDLDWERKAAINRALLEVSRADAGRADAGPFPPALQRFWLPRSEAGDTIPRAFQKEAYAFSKLLALTRERILFLSPGQDEDGRPVAQGPFWTALEGAAPWHAGPGKASSRFRMAWEGHLRRDLAEARAAAVTPRPLVEALSASGAAEDRAPNVLQAWRDSEGNISPSGLQDLAACPFRALAKRVWKLEADDATSSLAMHRGTLAHTILEAALSPFVDMAPWPAAFTRSHGLGDAPDAQDVQPILQGIWEAHRATWLAQFRDLPEALQDELALEVEASLPNLAAALARDLACAAPTKNEVAMLMRGLGLEQGAFPDKDGWSRRLLGTEIPLGPGELDGGDGLRLSLRGTADRVERWTHPEGPAFIRIMDYKASKAKRVKAFADGEGPFSTHLQTPVYALLAERQFGLPATAVLLPLKEDEPAAEAGIMKALAECEEPWRERLARRIGGLWRRAQAGDFPPTPGDACAFCTLGALCGRPVDIDVDEEAQDA